MSSAVFGCQIQSKKQIRRSSALGLETKAFRTCFQARGLPLSLAASYLTKKKSLVLFVFPFETGFCTITQALLELGDLAHLLPWPGIIGITGQCHQHLLALVSVCIVCTSTILELVKSS